MKTIRLAPNGVVALRALRGARIRVTAGRAWITEDGSPADHFVQAGDDYRVAGDGLVIVEDFAPRPACPELDISLTNVQIWK